VVPVFAGADFNGSEQPAGTAHEIVKIGTYVVDFNRVDVEAGSVWVDFYVNLESDTNVSLNDIELTNGLISSVSTVRDTPRENEYRIVAVLTAEPDLRHYPFDRHPPSIKLEPEFRNEQEMVFVTDPADNVLDPDADLSGWTFTGTRSAITNNSCVPDEKPFSRAVFSYGISRDAMSTIQKFFLPILLIIVSLSSLMMKVSSRFGLDASMFLAAVFIHWRVNDAIPAITYATFLDLFMIITHGTLVMYLLSSIILQKFTEDQNTARVRQVNYWSLRVIPLVSFGQYFLLFLTLLI
jgi:hypothetical protein